MKLVLLVFSFVLILSLAHAQPRKIYLSPKAAAGANQSLFIDSIKFHPLEATKGVSFGEYSYVIATDKYFIVTTSFDQTVVIYSQSGKFIKKINFKNLGENVYPQYDKNKGQLTFFFPNKKYALTKKDEIDIKTHFSDKGNGKYYKKYIIDLKDSNFVIQKAAVTAFDILKAYNLKDDYYCTYEIDVNKNYKDTLDYEVKIYKGTKFIKGYFPYNKQNEIRYLYARYANAVTQETRDPNIFYITRPYVDTVYALSNGEIRPVYKVVLPMENALPKSFFETPFKNATERENFERNNGWWLRAIYLPYETDRYMLFRISFLSNYGQYLYDKKTNASYNLFKVKPDSASYYLPLLNESTGGEEQGKFYKLITSDQLKKVYELNKGKTDKLPKMLQQSLQDTLAPKPLIVEYSIKNH